MNWIDVSVLRDQIDLCWSIVLVVSRFVEDTG